MPGGNKKSHTYLNKPAACAASKGFMKALKAFINPFDSPQAADLFK